MYSLLEAESGTGLSWFVQTVAYCTCAARPFLLYPQLKYVSRNNRNIAFVSLLQSMSAPSPASKEPGTLISNALRNAGLGSYARIASRLLVASGSTSLPAFIRAIREAGVPAPLISRGAQWLLTLMTVRAQSTT
jgi:hypothetical protein